MITVNGVDLRTIGFTARRRRVAALGGERTATAGVAGGIGHVVIGAGVDDARLVVEGHVADDDHAAMLARIDQIAAATRGECVIHFGDLPDREYHGILQQTANPFTALDPQWRSRAGSLTLTWLLPDPLAVAREWTIGDADAPLELGSAPSPIAVDVAASEAVTQITVEVMRGAAVLRSLEWSGELAPGDTWSVSDEAHEVTVGGVNAIDGLTPASVFPYADPAERADRVRVTADGDAMVAVRYRRRWW